MRIYWGAQRCSSHTSFTSSPSFIRTHSGKHAVAPPMWMCMLSNDGAPAFFFSVNLQQKNSSVPHNSHTVKTHTLLYEIKPLTLLAVHYNRSSSICTPWALRLYWYSSIIYMLSIGIHFSLWLLRIIIQNPSTSESFSSRQRAEEERLVVWSDKVSRFSRRCTESSG